MMTLRIIAAMKPQEIDLHRFELRYRDTRVQRNRMRSRLLQSIDTHGQSTPVIAISQESRFILIDGYLRYDVMQRLGRDTILTHEVDLPETEALLDYLCAQQAHRAEAIEQAWLIEQLMHQGLSLTQISQRLGKDKSWVSRRLSLLTQLPDPIQAAVRNATLSTWAAERVLKPLARANTVHAQRLLTSLQTQPLTTRELVTWFNRYQKSNQGEQEKLLDQPLLLIRALAHKDNTEQPFSFDGIDDRWMTLSKRIIALLKQLLDLVPKVLNPCTQSVPHLNRLTDAVKPINGLVEQLQKKIDEIEHDRRSNQNNHQATSPARNSHSGNQPIDAGVTQHCATLPQPTNETPTTHQADVAKHYLDAARSLLED